MTGLRVATWNIHRGRPAFGGFRPARAAEVLAEIGADLVALQEAQHHLARGHPMLDETRLDAAGLRILRVSAAQQGFRANLLLARPHVRVLHGPSGLRLGGWEPRGGIVAELDAGDGPFRVVCAHLSLGAGRRTRQAALLLDAARTGKPMPALLLGDFNERRADRGAMAVLTPLTGTPPHVPSFPALRPLLALDRILALPPGRVTELRAHDTKLARRASDHLPLLARFTPSGG